MRIIIGLFLIAVICVIIIDMSGITASVKNAVARFLTKHGRATDAENVRLKPFDCSFCMTFWVGLGFLFGSHAFTLPYLAALCLAALSTTIIDDLLRLIMDAAAALFNWIETKLK